MTFSVLFVFTSANRNLTGGQTGWYLPEAAHPYWVLIPHAKIDFAAPGGPNPEADAYSVQTFTDEGCVKFLQDETVNAKLANAKKLTEVNVKDYDAIFYVGGAGPVLDLAEDPVNAKLASEAREFGVIHEEQFYQAGKITSAVCHGPAALVQAVDASGKSVFAGKKCTGFSNFEEEIIDGVAGIPFLVQTRIEELGGKYEKAAEPWDSHVVVDGHLITGQNPASAGPIGEAILKALKQR
ncbi:hypothetical protein H0H92_001804 [Tricholoma furcatifolium]|nr:hypothetical protein H0H92_001804 [Tricholoma furcatifolium]